MKYSIKNKSNSHYQSAGVLEGKMNGRDNWWITLRLNTNKDSEVIFDTLKQYFEDLGFVLADINQNSGGRTKNGERRISTSQLSRHYARSTIKERENEAKQG